MIPEQVWDADDIPERGLFKGRPTGSAMPLVWAHAEYLKLRRSLADGRVFDTPAADGPALPRARRPASDLAIWRFDHQRPVDLAGRDACGSRCWPPPWSAGAPTAGRRPARRRTRDTGLGIHVADLRHARARERRTTIELTFHWPDAGPLGREDFTVAVI